MLVQTNARTPPQPLVLVLTANVAKALAAEVGPHPRDPPGPLDRQDPREEFNQAPPVDAVTILLNAKVGLVHFRAAVPPMELVPLGHNVEAEAVGKHVPVKLAER